MKQKISKAQYDEILKNINDIEKELLEYQSELYDADEKQIVDNCHRCKGTGQEEWGPGDPAFNPSRTMLYHDCPDCDGKGYIE